MKNTTLFLVAYMLLTFALAGFSQNTLTKTNNKSNVTVSKSEVEVYDFTEITITNNKANSTNAFLNCSLNGIFYTPSGDSMIVYGFADDLNGKVMSIRYMPQTPGTYKYKLEQNISGKTTFYTGTFSAKSSNRKGVVRVDKDYPTHFVYEGNGGHYFYNSTTTYLLLGWENDTEIFQAIDRLSKLKINRLRVALSANIKDGSEWHEPLVQNTATFKTRVSPWVLSKPDTVQNLKSNPEVFNLAFWQKIDRMLAFAREKEVQISIVFYVGGFTDDPFGRDNAGGDLEKMYYRYAVSRLASYSNVMWDLCNEYRNMRDDKWCREMGRYVKKIDPWKHLITVHGHETNTLYAEDWMDFVVFQLWDESGGYNILSLNSKLQQCNGIAKPIVNEEYGYEDHYPSWGGMSGTGRNAASRAGLALEMLMAGCYQTTGERATEGTGAGNDKGGGWINGRGDSSMVMLKIYAAYYDLFNSVEYWKLKSHSELVKGHGWLLANPGEAYIFYGRWGNPEITLVEGTYSVERMDVYSGVKTQLPNFTGTIWKYTGKNLENEKLFLLFKRIK